MSLTFDILILIIVCASSFFGLYSGFIKLSVSFVSFVSSILTAYFLYPLVEGFFIKHISHEIVLTITSATVAYIISLVIFAFISSRLLSLAKNISGGVFDRFLGLVAGLIRGGIISLMLFFTVIIFSSEGYINAESAADLSNSLAPEKYPDWLNESTSSKYLHEAGVNIVSKIPRNKLEAIKFDKGTPEEEL